MTTKLEELRKLAKAATPGPFTFNQQGVCAKNGEPYGDVIFDGGYYADGVYERDAAFIATINPKTILAMCNLMQQMRDALQSQVENISAYDDPEDTLFDYELHVVSALKAFDKFNKGE